MLGMAVLAVTAILLLWADFPPWVAVPYVAVGGVVTAARRERTPIAAGVALACSGAVLLHLLAPRRARGLTEGQV